MVCHYGKVTVFNWNHHSELSLVVSIDGYRLKKYNMLPTLYTKS
jgi:hypothetical protein